MYDKSHLYKIHRYLTGDCNPEEKARIEKWIREDPANRQIFEAIKKIWRVEPKKELQADLQKAWNRLEKQMQEKEEKIHANRRIYDLTHRFKRKSGSSGRYAWMRVAAIIVLGLLLSFYAILYLTDGELTNNTESEGTEMVMQEIKTDRAHQSEMTFTDGTIVRLNAASLIRFPQQFDSDRREVYLEGEAWFDVSHNPEVEFVVKTRDASVRVLGTEFNVRAHPDEQDVEVVVAEGTVSVQASTDTTEGADAGVFLRKGEMSRVKSGQPPISPQKVDISKYLSWLKGDFVFEETPFRRVLREWERRFDVDFEVENEMLLETPFTGEFRNESFEEMLRLTSITLEFSYSRKNDTITIKE